MISLHPQFIKDEEGNRSLVVLPADEFDKLIEELEEMEDIRLYDAAKKRDLVFTDAETVFANIEAKRKKGV